MASSRRLRKLTPLLTASFPSRPLSELRAKSPRRSPPASYLPASPRSRHDPSSVSQAVRSPGAAAYLRLRLPTPATCLILLFFFFGLVLSNMAVAQHHATPNTRLHSVAVTACNRAATVAARHAAAARLRRHGRRRRRRQHYGISRPGICNSQPIGMTSTTTSATARYNTLRHVAACGGGAGGQDACRHHRMPACHTDGAGPSPPTYLPPRHLPGTPAHTPARATSPYAAATPTPLFP